MCQGTIHKKKKGNKYKKEAEILRLYYIRIAKVSMQRVENGFYLHKVSKNTGK